MQDQHQFFEVFPIVEPPFTLTEESIEEIRNINRPIPQIFIDTYIRSWEPDEIDEFTEFVPCMQLAKTQNYRAFIYWRASLLKYEYVLVTLNKEDTLISRRVIAGMFVENNIIKSSAARIDHDLIIYIIAGARPETDDYNGEASQNFAMEIMDNGEIIFSLDA